MGIVVLDEMLGIPVHSNNTLEQFWAVLRKLPELLEILPAGRVSAVKRMGKVYFVCPDAGRKVLYAGNNDQYLHYSKLAQSAHGRALVKQEMQAINRWVFPPTWEAAWDDWDSVNLGFKVNQLMRILAGVRSVRAKLLLGLVNALLLLLVCAVPACAPNGKPIAESEYRTRIPGNWQGTVGDMKESISFQPDGSFKSQVRPLGFISNTLGQGVTGTIFGTWTIEGRVMTLKIDRAENETLRNKTTTSTVESLQANQMVVKSASGETSTFVRLL